MHASRQTGLLYDYSSLVSLKTQDAQPIWALVEQFIITRSARLGSFVKSQRNLSSSNKLNCIFHLNDIASRQFSLKKVRQSRDPVTELGEEAKVISDQSRRISSSIKSWASPELKWKLTHDDLCFELNLFWWSRAKHNQIRCLFDVKDRLRNRKRASELPYCDECVQTIVVCTFDAPLPLCIRPLHCI